ncbi:phosphoribosylanthranilate isomerase [Croceiramulus getboli]|nr:phosphoribosylanthranilate isomerase [Flavobacteriaceae bacterium YJPT1-3]
MGENVVEVASLRPDYLGFIFYEKSPRNFTRSLPALPDGIQRVGVFVDASPAFILDQYTSLNLHVIQLHGAESADFVQGLRQQLPEDIQIWKVFSIRDQFDFDRLQPYEGLVDAFLFDTKGQQPGGTGLVFDWSVLRGYSSTTPIVLSGGIGLEQWPAIEDLLASELPIAVIDVNSRFESAPGLKAIEPLKNFQKKLKEREHEY